MRFAIHPVAGRLVGHMNVLVIGTNDVVNPDALDDPSFKRMLFGDTKSRSPEGAW